MYPPGHLAFGYLCYSAYARLRRKRPPPGDEALAVALGTQFPDLVDKPLYLLGLWPHHRFVGHSLVTIALLALIFRLVPITNRRRRKLIAPFLIGFLSHTISDHVFNLVFGYPFGIGFGYILWPFDFGTPHTIQLEELDDHYSFFGADAIGDAFRFSAHLFSGDFVVLWVIVGVAVWYYDGQPGMRELSSYLRRD